MKTFQQFFEERRSEFTVLKQNREILTGAEKQKAMKAGCVWHKGPGGSETCAIYKSKDTKGNVWYFGYTHRFYTKDKTLDGMIAKWHKEVEPTA